MGFTQSKPNAYQFLDTLRVNDTTAHERYTDLIAKTQSFLEKESDRDGQEEVWDVIVELGHAILKARELIRPSPQPKLVSVRLIWDKDDYRTTDRYGLAIEQLLEKLKARAVDCDGIPTLYVCRSSTGRLEDIDHPRFLSIEGKRALVVVRTGQNEDVFGEDYSAATSRSLLQDDLAVSLIIWNNRMIETRRNSETVKKLADFLKN
jgi:hypothetical protein